MKYLRDICAQKELKDPHTLIYNGKIIYTFTAGTLRKRLDKFFFSNHLQNRLINYNILPNLFSDHEGITIHFDIGTRKKWGKGTWKLNNEILEEERYRNFIKEVIEEILENKIVQESPANCWERLKKKVKKS